MKQAKILLTGATGTVGTQLAIKLNALQIPFRALVRNKENELLKSLPYAAMITGDLGNERSVGMALQGIEKVFLLTNSSEQAEQLQLNFVNAAHKAGAEYIVKLSQLAAKEQSPVRFLHYHAKVENRIKEMGLTYTFLRPNLYMQGFLALKDYIKNDGKFYAAVGDAGVSLVDVRDIAAVAASTLTEAGHENKTYNITGNESLTHYQLADIFSTVLGKKVTFIDVSPKQMEAALQAAGFPEWQLGGLIEDYAHYARGEAAQVYNSVKEVTGIPAISFEQFVSDHKALFL
jgi:uncharacterized protein YbjT (DUF2867 family)